VLGSTGRNILRGPALFAVNQSISRKFTSRDVQQSWRQLLLGHQRQHR